MIDGEIDSVWDKAVTLNVNKFKIGERGATGDFKLLWDEQNLYVLGNVNDSVLSKTGEKLWDQDSVEFYLDENFGRTTFYENDDRQYRIRYDNYKSGAADVDKLKSETKVVSGGYLLEVAIPLNYVNLSNGKNIGFDIGINDDPGTGVRTSASTFNDIENVGWYDTSSFSILKMVDNTGTVTPATITVTTVAAAITSVVTPAKDATSLTLPTVPQGYTIAIKSATSTPSAIALDGTITPPVADTTVALVFTVTTTTSSSAITADTISINVVVPAKTVVVMPPIVVTSPVVTTTVVVPVVTKVDANSNVVATLDSSKINKDAVNKIDIDQPKPESKVSVQIPASSIGTGTGSFQINTKAVSLNIPTSIIDSSLLSSGGTLQVSQNLMATTDAKALLANASLSAKTNGKVFTLGMAVCDSNNNVVSDIHNFATGKSVGITINLSNDDIKGMDTSKISAFYFDVTSKKWIDMGGSFDSAKMTYTFNTTHFTDFTIMQKSVINRLSGLNRIETSIAIAKEQYSASKPDAVVLATANDFADALAGSGLAYKYNAPLLLVNKSVSESQSVIDYITANLSKDKNIYILGETGAVSKEIADYLTAQGYKIIRLGGKDRYETNQKIVDYLNVVKGTSLVITTSDDFADALSISSIADIKGFPVLLNGKDNLSASVSSYITNLQPTTVYVVGGAGVLSTNIEDQIKKLNGNIKIVRLGGKDRYETSMMIVDYFNLPSTTIAVATGVDFPDALSGSVLAARKNSSVLLVDNKDVTKQKELVTKQKITNVIVFGGEGVVRSDIMISLIQK